METNEIQNIFHIIISSYVLDNMDICSGRLFIIYLTIELYIIYYILYHDWSKINNCTHWFIWTPSIAMVLLLNVYGCKSQNHDGSNNHHTIISIVCLWTSNITTSNFNTFTVDEIILFCITVYVPSFISVTIYIYEW